MKRKDLVRHLKSNGCKLLREGGKHSWWYILLIIKDPLLREGSLFEGDGIQINEGPSMPETWEGS